MDRNTELASAITASAGRLGISPHDLATVISYETGGTFDPWAKGPRTQWGEHRGLIQWGEAQREKYGVHEGMTVTAQLEATERYLTDAGVRPGMGRLDIYSAINAGGVGRYNASDAHNGGAPGTVRDKVETQMAGHAEKAAALLGGTLDFSVSRSHAEAAPQFAPAGTPQARVELNDAERRLEAIDRQEQEGGLFSLMSSAYRMENTLGRAAIAGIDPGHTPDLDYAPTAEELDWRRQGLPQKYWDQLIGVSPAHSDWLTRRARGDWEAERQLAKAGWGGVAASIVASVTDVPAILAGVALGGAGTAVAKAASMGRIGQRIASAASGAAGSLAVEGTLSAMGRPTDLSDYVYAAGMGSLFGFAFGPVISNPATHDVAAQGIAASRKFMMEMEDRGDLMSSTAISSGSVGAAGNTGALTPLISQQDWLAVSDAYVDRAVAGSARFDVAGRTGSSDNPAARLVSPHIMTDTAGRVDQAGNIAVNPIAADQVKTSLSLTYRSALARTYKPAFEEWAKENGFGLIGRTFGSEAHSVFGDLVSSYVRTRSPMLREAFPEPVRRVGERMADLFDELRQDNINPLRDRGGEGRPLAGFENVPANRNYLPIVYDDAKIAHVLETFGERAAREVLSGSLLSGNPGRVDPDIAERIAHGVLKNFRSRHLGLADRFTRVLAGSDDDFLRSVLTDLGLASDDVERTVSGLAHADKTGPAPAKARLGFDEGFVLKNVSRRDGSGVADLRFTDLTVNNPVWLFDRYVDQMAGWVALGRVSIDDPLTGKRLVDGLRSEREIEQLLHHMRGRGADVSDGNQGKLARSLEADEKNFRFAFDRILGKPHDSSGTDLARWMGVVRNWNFARLMGNLGVAQVMEIGSPVAYVGIRAMLQHMPGFRRVIDNGESVLASGMDRELEAVLGIGTDPLRGTMSLIANEAVGMVDGAGGARLIDRAENLSRHAAHVTNVLSGGRDVTAGMQKWAAKLMAQKFSDMAELAIGRDNLGTAGRVDLSRIRQRDLNRMRYLGLSDDMLGRVLSEVKANGEFADGALFDGKLMQLNLDRWGDLETRSAFEMALFRASRKMIQETDIGAMHRWASAPLAQTLFQFRTFALTAWTNQFLHNVALKDTGSLIHMSATLMSAALVYAVQTHIQAQFREDKDDFLEKRLNPQALASASFQRSGWSSILPMAIDSALLFTPFDPMFDFRTSQQASDGLFGNPTVALMDDLRAASQGVFRPLMDGREMSQEELRAVTRLTALQNWMPLASIYSTMVQDRQRKPLRTRQGYGLGEMIGIGGE